MRPELPALFLVALACSCARTTDDDFGDAGAPHPSTVDAARDAIALGNPATGDDGAAGDATIGDDDAAITGKSCLGLADGTLCGSAPDACHDPPVCASGACASPAAKADGTVCAAAPDACHTDGTCAAGACGAIGARADGYEWTAGDATARCCGGKEVHTTSETNCGACGIACNASNGESCQADHGVYFCRGCVASADCWSKCCSTSFTPNTCAASDCAGNCDAAHCPPGTHCVSGAGVTSDYCSY